MPEESDELLSAASLALVEAARTFDPSRKVGFASFARMRIYGKLIDVRREIRERESRELLMKSLFELDSSDFDGPGDGAAQLAYEAEIGSELQSLETIERWIERLPRPHALAIRHIYLDGKSQCEAAELVGCSKPTMSRLHSQGLHLLQKERDFILDD
jgi:RNA polymerase sigma factor (sigma-70 family)